MDEATWRAKAQKDNRGRPPERLAYRPEPAIELGPLVWKSPSSSRGSTPGTGWRPMRTHAHPDNQAILDDLDGGIQAIRLDRNALGSARDLARCLKSVPMEAVHWAFAEGDFGSAAALVGLWRGLGLDDAQLDADFGLDPLSRFARTGFAAGSVEEQVQAAAELASWTCSNLPNSRTFQIDGTVWHDAGADDSLALGLSIAALVSYIRAMDARSMSTQDAFDQVGLRLAVGGQFLAGVATLRAGRRITSRVAELCGVETSVSITATTATRELTERDPWVNILRITASAFAGIVGGAQVIDLPVYLNETPEQARLARNIHNILREEAHLDRVIDPAGGAHALEELTDQIAHAAWRAFQQVEAEGGLLLALRSGWVAERVQGCRARHERRVRTRAVSVLGVSRFANLDEQLPKPGRPLEAPTEINHSADPIPTFEGLLEVALQDPLASLNEARVPAGGRVERCAPCPPWSRAEPFEAFRRRPNAPNAFIAALGPLSSHTARTAFGEELLAAGGIRCMSHDDGTIEGAVTGLQASGSSIALVSATGAYFNTQAEAAVTALAAHAAQVWVLGDPQDAREPLIAAGATGFLHRGIDVVATLNALWEVR